MQETIGQQLKNLRVSRQISLDKAAEATRIRAPYLQALEEDNYSVMSSAAQGRGFLKIYADYLGLDLDAATRELQRGDMADAPPAAPAPEPTLSTPEPVSALSAPPASSEATADRRPFWARLLRRSAPEADASPQPEPVVVEEPSPAAPPAIPEVELEPESIPAPAKKPAARKTKSSAKVSKPKSSTSSAKTKKPADKKKGSLKKPSAKK